MTPSGPMLSGRDRSVAGMNAIENVNGPVFRPDDDGFHGELSGYQVAHPHRPDLVVGATSADDARKFNPERAARGAGRGESKTAARCLNRTFRDRQAKSGTCRSGVSRAIETVEDSLA